MQELGGLGRIECGGEEKKRGTPAIVNPFFGFHLSTKEDNNNSN